MVSLDPRVGRCQGVRGGEERCGDRREVSPGGGLPEILVVQARRDLCQRLFRLSGRAAGRSFGIAARSRDGPAGLAGGRDAGLSLEFPRPGAALAAHTAGAEGAPVGGADGRGLCRIHGQQRPSGPGRRGLPGPLPGAARRDQQERRGGQHRGRANLRRPDAGLRDPVRLRRVPDGGLPRCHGPRYGRGLPGLGRRHPPLQPQGGPVTSGRRAGTRKAAPGPA